jgi:hypothetical protein
VTGWFVAVATTTNTTGAMMPKGKFPRCPVVVVASEMYTAFPKGRVYCIVEAD